MSLHRIRLIIWKEFLQLRRDPLLLRLIFIMPIVQLIFFGYVVSAVRNLATAVVDLDRTAISRQLTGGSPVLATSPSRLTRRARPSCSRCWIAAWSGWQSSFLKALRRGWTEARLRRWALWSTDRTAGQPQ